MLTRGQRKVFSALLENKRGLHLREICRQTKLSVPAVKAILDKACAQDVASFEKRGRMKIFRLNFARAQTISIVQFLDGERFGALPAAVREGYQQLLEEAKERPLVAAIFGSYATGGWTKTSDLDILLVFQRLDQKLFRSIENTARIISERSGVNIQPVSLSYDEFERKFLDKEDSFMAGVREVAIPLYGFELYYKTLARFLA